MAIGTFGVWCGINLCEAVNRSHEKRTLQAIVAFASALEHKSVLPEAIDGWGRPLQVTGDHNSYTLISYGRDGIPDRRIKGGEIENYDCDIVYSNGAFIQWSGGF